MASSGVALAFAGAVRVVSEPRRLSTGFVLLAAVVLLGAGAAVVVAGLIPATSPGGGAVALVVVPLAVAGIGLIVNGLGLMRRDGIAPLTATPVVVGAGLLFLLAAAAMVESGPRVPSWAGRVTVIAIVAGVYLVVHMIAFGGYALLYGTLPVRPEADAVVILGCGLDRRSVTPLLAARLDRGIAVYDVAVRSGHDLRRRPRDALPAQPPRCRRDHPDRAAGGDYRPGDPALKRRQNHTGGGGHCAS